MRVKRTQVIVLGSTGSIGTQALELIADNPERFQLAGIAAYGSDPSALIAQARAHDLDPAHIAVVNPQAAHTIAAELGGDIISGEHAAQELVRRQAEHLDGNDVILNALVGSLGLNATLAALDTPARLALANKESLVAGGKIVLDASSPGQLFPVDSEHSAMAQCLHSGRRAEVSRFVLTASGGPFRGWTREQLETVTPQQAAAHPTWSMGQMNTLNSASLVNKGLELIEASLLFDIEARDIDVTVHPQSIVHSMVTFHDGSTIAQASPPSMKLPISYALGYPERIHEAQAALDFSTASTWEFEPLDDEVFPAVALARQAVQAGGAMPAVYNAANEEAAAKFLAGQLAFPRIVDTISAVMNECAHLSAQPRDLDDVHAAEKEARARAQERLTQWISSTAPQHSA